MAIYSLEGEKWERISNLTILLFVAVPIILIAVLVAFGVGMFAVFPVSFLSLSS